MGGELGAEEAVLTLSAVTGRPYELVGRLAGGETGAHQVRGPEGAPLVVKWVDTPRARGLRTEGVVFSERLRTVAGWPVPRAWTVDGGAVLFVVQTFMPGRPPEHMDEVLVTQLLDLHERRRGMARPGDPIRWPEALITTLTQGGDGYCRHDSLRGYDRRTAELLERIRRFGSILDPTTLVGRDVVHWDLHPENLLVDRTGLTAIVDTDFTMVGDGAFDLVMLALTSTRLPVTARARDLLWDAAFNDIDAPTTQAYLAHLFLRVLDWPIRRGAPDEIEHWLDLSRTLLTL